MKKYSSHKTEQIEASALILAPQVNDIYFLDLRLLGGKLERNNEHKYKLAKVIRVSDENLTIVYGTVLYQWQHAVVSSIEYGLLSNNDYFKLIPDYISFSKIKEMRSNGAIYLVKRPIRNRLYGDFVSPD